MPMVAIADALAQSGVAPSDVVFVGSRRGQERNLLGGRNERLILLPGRGLRRSFTPRAVINNVGALVRVAWSVVVAITIVVRLRPRMVVSVGGYAAFPMVTATVVTSRPRRRLCLVELDATPGLVHRLAAPWARVLLFGIEPHHAVARSQVVGVPLRDAIEGIDRSAPAVVAAKAARGIAADVRSIVVMTGSLGARRVNDAVVELAEQWRDRTDVVITHVTGQRDSEYVAQRALGRTGPNYRLVPFESDMPSLWAATDIAVCRAGAATVAELTYLGIPSILVPLPHAPGDHQTKNAESLERRHAAIVIRDADCTASSLGDALAPLLDDQQLLVEMVNGSRTLRRVGAARRIAEIVSGVWPPRHVHVVGAGGAGMSGVVRYFVEAGSTVSGSDRAPSHLLTELSALGSFAVGANVVKAGAADLVTWSPAVNPELDDDVRAGQSRGLARPDLLALIARHHTTMAVTGTHGKTTASSMLVHIARAAQWNPSWLLGADIRDVGANGHFGGDTLVLELDESYGSFRKTVPHGLAILNVESDHLDHYGTLGALEAAFCELAATAVGPVVLFRDGVGPDVVNALTGAVTVGFGEEAAWRIESAHTTRNGSSCVVRSNEATIAIDLLVPGRHNLVNAAVVGVLAYLYGATPEQIHLGLSNFRGAPRRFEWRGKVNGVDLIDDYAHLPTEVAATLQAARDLGAQRILAVFQPHRITRTTALAKDFATSFDLAATVIVTDIYSAGEPNPDGVTGQIVVDALRSQGVSSVSYVTTLRDVEAEIAQRASDYDMVVVMGAGDIASVVDILADRS